MRAPLRKLATPWSTRPAQRRLRTRRSSWKIMWLTKDASHKAADVDEEFSKRRVFEFLHASSCSVCMALLQQNTILLVRISHIGQSLSFVPRRVMLPIS